MTPIQGGSCANQGGHTKSALFSNIIKHAHRTNSPLYVVSTDMRKGFDLVYFKAFNTSLKIMGFSPKFLKMMDAVQSDFSCYVRTPAGNTASFPVTKGCKQGCPFSPLRFNIVMEIFLRYLSESRRGYHWNLSSCPRTEDTPRFANSENGELIIPGSAFIDDLIFFSNSLTEIKQTVSDLECFLKACGTSLNIRKCNFTCINTDTCNLKEAQQGIRSVTGGCINWQDQTKPVKYLGQRFVISGSDDLSVIFTHQRAHIAKVFHAALNRFRNMRLRPQHVAHMLNSDVMSTLGYFLPFAALTGNQLKKMRYKLNSVLRNKLRIPHNSPMLPIFLPASNHGLGVHDPAADTHAAAVDVLMQALSGPDFYARVTTEDTIKSIQHCFPSDPFNDKKFSRQLPTWCKNFPSYLHAAATALSRSGISLTNNTYHYTEHDVTVCDIIRLLPAKSRIKLKHITEAQLEAFCDTALPHRLADVFPALVCHPTSTSDSETCSKDGLITSNDSTSDCSSIGMQEDNPLPRNNTFAYDSDKASSIRNEYSRSVLELYLDDSLHVISNLRLIRLLQDSIRSRTNYNPANRELYDAVVYTVIRCLEQCRLGLCATPFTLRRNTIPFWNSFPVHTSTYPFNSPLVLATDGSLKDNIAGAAVVGDSVSGPDCRFRFSGRQTVARAESFAILAALNMADPHADLTIWSDSQSTLNAITHLQAITSHTSLPPSRIKKQIKNYSIIKAIVDLIHTRNSRTGVRTTLNWVHSHAEGDHDTDAQVLNDRADAHAERARLGDVTRTDAPECYHTLGRWLLTIKSDNSLIETCPHTIVLEKAQIKYFEENKIAACKTSVRLTSALNIVSSDCMSASSTSFTQLMRQRTNTSIFAFNLLYNNIENPHDSYVTNKHNYPNIYPDDICPLCHKPRADIYHILCECKSIRLHRLKSIKNCASNIQSKLETKTNTPHTQTQITDWINRSCFPDKNSFNYGFIPDTFFQELDSNDPAHTTNNHFPVFAIQNYIYNDLFFNILREYKSALYRSHNSFSQRLRKSYNITMQQKKNTDYLARQNTAKNKHSIPQTPSSQDIRKFFKPPT